MSVSIIKGTKSVKEAAAEIGVTDRTLRQWIANFIDRCPSGRGKPRNNECRAEKVEDLMFPAGYVYQVPVDEVERLRSLPQTGPGRPRLSQGS
jgi:transposase-like protein